jgi:hypothetical protein
VHERLLRAPVWLDLSFAAVLAMFWAAINMLIDADAWTVERFARQLVLPSVALLAIRLWARRKARSDHT